MMRLLPMKESKAHRGEPVISLVCGAPALSIGLGAIVLLLSYVADVPIGLKEFYKTVPVGKRDEMGLVVRIYETENILPSRQLQGMLFAGACWAGVGIYLSRRRWPHRKVTTSAAGLIVCASAYFLAWSLFVKAAYR
jgi:hypothetical protein